MTWFTNILLSFFFISSCSQAPIKRKHKGSRYYNNYSGSRKYKSQKKFNPKLSPIKKKVALLPFFNESPYGKEDLAITATEEFRKEISRTRDFVVDPNASAVFGSSKEVYTGGGVKLTQLQKKAKIAGINLVVIGRITHARVRQKVDEIGFVRKTKSYAESILEIRIFDVHANKELYVDKMDGNIDDSSFRFFMTDPSSNLTYRRELLRYSIKVAVRRFIPRLHKLGSKLGWTGRVAKIVGSKIYVNAGSFSGIQIGDILKVMTEGEDIFDPETGGHIGVSQGEIKGTLEITEYFGQDGSIAILHSGGSVAEGDYVRLY